MKKIIENFNPAGGWHCVSNSIKQVLHFNNVNLSEEMIIGLASTLNFIYWDTKDSPFPFIGGRIKIGEFEDNLAESLNIKIQFKESASPKKAYQDLRKMIQNDIPAVVYVDMAYLDYLNLPEEAHFGGHAIVVFGIDEEQGVAYVSDRDAKDFKISLNENEEPKDFHLLSLENLEKARDSKFKPYPPKNRVLQFDFSDYREINKDVVSAAILKTMTKLLEAPIKNLGINGIKHFSEKINEWAEYPDEQLKLAALNSFIMINQVGGNGGGCFRRLFGRFMIEAGKDYFNNFDCVAGNEYLKIANLWDAVADKLMIIYNTCNRTLLHEISEKLFIIYIKELELAERTKEAVCEPEN